MRAMAFAGTERFQLRRLLGAGGMGVVFAAFDREHGYELALKVLPTVGPVAGDQIKREFRVASGTHHPNLVSLGELIEHDGYPFFTMELVVGVDWLSHVRGLDSSSRPDVQHRRVHAQSQTALLSNIERSDSAAGPTPAIGERRPHVDATRLRSALQQLVCGLMHLHAHGKVHRDVKPSNVAVSDEGRVVLLDFGLAFDLARPIGDTHRVGGTALYMSPEQARNAAPTPASDWYSVGVLLHEALTTPPRRQRPPERARHDL